MKIVAKKPTEMTHKRPTVFCQKFIPLQEQSVTMLFAGGGIGKSYSAIKIAIEYILETGKTACLWLTEDSEGENYHRFMEIVNSFYANREEYIVERISFVSEAPVKFSKLDAGNYVLTPEYYETRLSLYEHGLVVIDPLLQFAGCDENSNTGAGVVMGGLKTWAREENKVILIVHHSTKVRKGENGETLPPSSRGAGEWQNGCRAVYSVGTLGIETNKLKFKLAKGNGIGRYFRNHFGSYERELEIFGTFTHSEFEEDDMEFKHMMSFANHNSVTPSGFVPQDVSYFYDLHLKLSDGKAYSQYTFKDGYRKGENNTGSASMICLDFDDGLTIAEARKKFSNVKSLILTTRSHQKDKGGVKCDRFRVIIPLISPLSISTEDYPDFLNVLYKKVGGVDGSTKDLARFFFASPKDAEYYYSDSDRLLDWRPIYDKMLKERVSEKLKRELVERQRGKDHKQYTGTPSNTLPKDTMIETKQGTMTFATMRETMVDGETIPCKCIDGIDHGDLGKHHMSAMVKKSNGNVFYHCSGGRCSHKESLWCEE